MNQNLFSFKIKTSSPQTWCLCGPILLSLNWMGKLRAGTFDDAGVMDLNRRAEAVMLRLGVTMTRNYDMTHGQIWGTPPQDGR